MDNTVFAVMETLLLLAKKPQHLTGLPAGNLYPQLSKPSSTLALLPDMFFGHAHQLC